jgi:ParB family chromosome partitioning protein
MIKKTRTGLGSGMEEMSRGINELYRDNTMNTNLEQETNVNIGLPLQISIDKITINPDQPRKNFNTTGLTKLADSIKNKGIIQPLVVRFNEEKNNYQLIAGHRRLMAAKQAGLKEVPTIIYEVPDDSRQRLELAMIENLFRNDLNPIEEAEAFYRLKEEFGQDVLEIAKLFGKDRSTIINCIRLLDLPDVIKDDIRNEIITSGHGRAILSITDKNNMLDARNIIVNKNLTVREAENLAKKINNKNRPKNQKNNIDDKENEYLNDFCKNLSNRLGGLSVNIINSVKNKKIEIYYNNNEEIENIMKILGVSVS